MSTQKSARPSRQKTSVVVGPTTDPRKLEVKLDPSMPQMAATYDYLADKHGYDARLKDRAFETAFDQLVSDVRALAAVGPEDRAIRDALQATGLQVYDTATYIEDEPEEPVQM